MPPYGDRSLSDVLLAVVAAFGEPGADMGIGQVRGAVVLLIDGLGTQLLGDHDADALPLRMRDAEPLTAGSRRRRRSAWRRSAPSCRRREHGLVGLSFRTDGHLLDTLRCMPVGRKADLRDVLPPESVQPPPPTALERAEAAGIAVTVVSNHRFRGSGLTARLGAGASSGPCTRSATWPSA